MHKPLKVVYITSRGHSGSTLLDLLISSHSRVVSVGEIKVVNRSPRPRCTCGAPTVCECPFWQQVADVLEGTAGLRLWDLDLGSPDPGAFRLYNRELFQAVARVSGKDVIVDSSKNLARLKPLLGCRAFEVVPVHLIRSPFGVVFSNVKKGRSWVKHCVEYPRALLETRRLLRGREHVVVRYEQLVRDPAGTLAGVMGRLGLAFEPEQLAWAGRERHNVGGNRMRFARDSTIRLDTAWRTGLTPGQKAAIGLLTLPARLPTAVGFPLYRAMSQVGRVTRLFRKRAA